MELSFLIKGLILGIAVAMPVGPIGILCINRTLNKNYLSGIISGMGAATADMMYGVIAAFGLTFISNFLIDHRYNFQIVGGIFLLFMGIRTYRKKKVNFDKKEIPKGNLIRDYFSTFILTLSNPATILFFTAIFAAMGLANINANYISALILIAGVFAGSGIWWIFLSGITNKFRYKISTKFLHHINIISGIGIVIFSIIIIIDWLRNYLQSTL